MFEPREVPQKKTPGSTTIPTTDIHIEDRGQATVLSAIHLAGLVRRERKLWDEP